MDITASHLVICTKVIDLGTQTIPAKPGKNERKSRQVWLEFEFVGTLKEGTTYRLTTAVKFDYYTKEGAYIRKFVEGWRGADYTEETISRFDVRKLLGQPGNATLKTYNGKNGVGYQIESMAPLKPGQDKPTPKSKLVSFWMDGNLDYSTLSGLPGFLRTQIETSPEYKQLVGAPLVAESIDDLPF